MAICCVEMLPSFGSGIKQMQIVMVVLHHLVLNVPKIFNTHYGDLTYFKLNINTFNWPLENR